MQTDGIWKVFPRSAPAGVIIVPAVCPSCHQMLRLDDAGADEYELPAALGRIVRVRCWKGYCSTGPCQQKYALLADDSELRYSFECKTCGVYEPWLNQDRLCSACLVLAGVGMGEAQVQAWRAQAEENDPKAVNRRTDQIMDGFLHGVALGMPGYVCPDP